MMEGAKTNDQLKLQIKGLLQQLEEANETIEAIRGGQIDALVVREKKGPEIYTLKRGHLNYRVFIENMIEGAVTLNSDGVILYSNSRVGTMLEFSLEKIVGSYFEEYLETSSKKTFNKLFKNGWKSESKGEINLLTHTKKIIPVLLSLNSIEVDEVTSLSMIITDLTDQKAIQQELNEKNILLESARVTAENLNNELELRVEERTHELLQSREHFKFLADNIPVIIWTATSNGDADYFNHQWYNYTGLNFEESKNGWKLVIHPEDISDTIVEWKLFL
jgi:two-component system CheB/CheR fusion protein